MPLPVGQLGRSSFKLRDQWIPIRSVSRKQSFEIAAAKDNPEECEVLILMYGTDSTREEVALFRESEGDGQAITDLIRAISKLSGILFADDGDSAGNGHSGPKV